LTACEAMGMGQHPENAAIDTQMTRGPFNGTARRWSPLDHGTYSGNGPITHWSNGNSE
jgi:hypothetical protein